MTSIARDALLRHLIPDLANMVLEYCWMKIDNYSLICEYGNYEKAKSLHDSGYGILHKSFHKICQKGYTKIIKINMHPYWHDDLNWNYGFLYACNGGHMETVKSIIDFTYEWGKELDWGEGIDVCYQGGHMEIAKMLIQEKEFKYRLYRSVIAATKNAYMVCCEFKRVLHAWIIGSCLFMRYALLRM